GARGAADPRSAHLIPLPLAAVSTLGTLVAEADVVTGVEIDSRRVSPGDLFVAIGDGAAYVEDARRRGAAATLVPDDAFAALASIGRSVRELSRARVVAITGSVGKTSTKDILAALLRPHVRLVAAEAGYNNELGLPLTLCRLEPDTDVVVAEMGMRALGQIRALAEIARPDVAVITAIAPVHLELLGSIENIVRAKAVCALTVCAALDVPLPEEVVEVSFSRWRSQETELPGGGLLINDAWNANPVAMRAALEHLQDRAGGRRTVAILGEMAELGEAAPGFHAEVARAAAGVDLVVGVGELARAYEPDEWVATAAEAAVRAPALVQPGDV